MPRSATRHQEQRRHQRHAVNLTAKFESDGHAYACRIKDLSLGGAGLSISPMPTVQFGTGTLVSNVLGSIPCIVRWQSIDGFGVQFDLSDQGRRQLREKIEKCGIDL